MIQYYKVSRKVVETLPHQSALVIIYIYILSHDDNKRFEWLRVGTIYIYIPAAENSRK